MDRITLIKSYLWEGISARLEIEVVQEVEEGKVDTFKFKPIAAKGHLVGVGQGNCVDGKSCLSVDTGGY